MKSLGTFPLTPACGKKLRLSGIKNLAIPIPVSSWSATPNLFGQPITDQDHSQDCPSGAQHAHPASHSSSSSMYQPAANHGCHHGCFPDPPDIRPQSLSSPLQQSHVTHSGCQQDCSIN